jgi:S1-C subfamily serine protease
MGAVGALTLLALSAGGAGPGPLSVADIAERALPSVVSITSTWPGGGLQGSGFVVDPSGIIVTNLHVIRGAATVTVKTAKGEVFDRVRIRTFDERRDLASYRSTHLACRHRSSETPSAFAPVTPLS